MRQIVLKQPGEFIETACEAPEAVEDLALVRIHRIGVCGTDLHAFAGRQPFFEYPRILGHELGVEVMAVGPNDQGIKAGDHCAVEPYLVCGTCHACRLGKQNCCESIQVLGVHTDGGMRPLMHLPVELLHKSETLSLERLALVETLGIGAHAVLRSGLQQGEEVLIVGAGPIGLATLQFAQAALGKVRVLEVNQSRRDFVETLGVEVLAEPDGRLAEVVFDATGNQHAMEASFAQVAHGGRLVMVGFVQDRISFESPTFHRREMTLLASRNSWGDFPRIIRMIEQGKIDTSPWITHRMKLAHVPSDFPDLHAQPGLVKAIIEVSRDDD